MADVLSNEGMLMALQRVFTKFDLWCERVGPCCNAGLPRPFTNAECDVQPIFDWGKEFKGRIHFEFQSLFGTGFELISDLNLGKRKFEELDSHFKKAFEILDNFMKNKSMHEKSIAALLKNGDNLKETVVTTALAEHLLSKLAPGQSYTVDKNCRNTEDDMCKCGCMAKINFEDTGIGHEEVWHGFVDIMFSSHNGIEPEAVAVMPAPESDTETESDIEPVTKKCKQGEKSDSDEKDSSPGGTVKVDLIDYEDTDNQSIAQAIVFSLLQKQRHPEFEILLIPTIVISSTKFKILMYDAENDILLRSKSIDLFLEQGSSEIPESCIIILWMILHYRIFSSDLKKIALNMDLDKLKSGFMDRIPPKCIEIYKSKLKSCVASFPDHADDHDGRRVFVVNKPRLLDFGILLPKCQNPTQLIL